MLENLEPKRVFYFFEEICKIPHGSGNLGQISAYLEGFARERGLFCIHDNMDNVIIVKEAAEGYEDVEPIILQGHIDMVAVKKNDCDIDMEKDALRLCTDGDYVYADGTSLGGDDGIAVAYILALLDADDIPHPRIEAVLTADEEVGMDGATAIDLSMLKARRMLNIDSEEEGTLLTSCAGGVRADCHIPAKRVSRSTDTVCLELKVGGLIGGHSGSEINKNRANAIKLLGITLCQLSKQFDIMLADMDGGEKDNAIPIEARAVFCIEKDKKQDFIREAAGIADETKSEYQSKEKGLFIRVEEWADEKSVQSVFDLDGSKKIIAFLAAMPNGVQAMSADMEGLVETSLNAGILKCDESGVEVSLALRSAIEASKEKLKLQLEALVGLTGGSIAWHGDYPGWQYNPSSKLRADMVRIYSEMFGAPVKVEAIHAGLECGIMVSKIPGLDCVSFGPDILDIHTTGERLSISSVKRMWEYLLEILKQK